MIPTAWSPPHGPHCMIPSAWSPLCAWSPLHGPNCMVPTAWALRTPCKSQLLWPQRRACFSLGIYATRETLGRTLPLLALQVTLDSPPHAPPAPQLPRRALQQQQPPLFEGNGSALVFGGAQGALPSQRVEAVLHNLRHGVPGAPHGAAEVLVDIGGTVLPRCHGAGDSGCWDRGAPSPQSLQVTALWSFVNLSTRSQTRLMSQQVC